MRQLREKSTGILDEEDDGSARASSSASTTSAAPRMPLPQAVNPALAEWVSSTAGTPGIPCATPTIKWSFLTAPSLVLRDGADGVSEASAPPAAPTSLASVPAQAVFVPSVPLGKPQAAAAAAAAVVLGYNTLPTPYANGTTAAAAMPAQQVGAPSSSSALVRPVTHGPQVEPRRSSVASDFVELDSDREEASAALQKQLSAIVSSYNARVQSEGQLPAGTAAAASASSGSGAGQPGTSMTAGPAGIGFYAPLSDLHPLLLKRPGTQRGAGAARAPVPATVAAAAARPIRHQSQQPNALLQAAIKRLANNPVLSQTAAAAAHSFGGFASARSTPTGTHEGVVSILTPLVPRQQLAASKAGAGSSGRPHQKQHHLVTGFGGQYSASSAVSTPTTIRSTSPGAVPPTPFGGATGSSSARASRSQIQPAVVRWVWMSSTSAYRLFVLVDSSMPVILNEKHLLHFHVRIIGPDSDACIWTCEPGESLPTPFDVRLLPHYLRGQGAQSTRDAIFLRVPPPLWKQVALTTDAVPESSSGRLSPTSLAYRLAPPPRSALVSPSLVSSDTAGAGVYGSSASGSPHSGVGRPSSGYNNVIVIGRARAGQLCVKGTHSSVSAAATARGWSTGYKRGNPSINSRPPIPSSSVMTHANQREVEAVAVNAVEQLYATHARNHPREATQVATAAAAAAAIILPATHAPVRLATQYTYSPHLGGAPTEDDEQLLSAGNEYEQQRGAGTTHRTGSQQQSMKSPPPHEEGGASFDSKDNNNDDASSQYSLDSDTVEKIGTPTHHQMTTPKRANKESTRLTPPFSGCSTASAGTPSTNVPLRTIAAESGPTCPGVKRSRADHDAELHYEMSLNGGSGSSGGALVDVFDEYSADSSVSLPEPEFCVAAPRAHDGQLDSMGISNGLPHTAAQQGYVTGSGSSKLRGSVAPKSQNRVTFNLPGSPTDRSHPMRLLYDGTLSATATAATVQHTTTKKRLFVDTSPSGAASAGASRDSSIASMTPLQLMYRQFGKSGVFRAPVLSDKESQSEGDTAMDQLEAHMRTTGNDHGAVFPLQSRAAAASSSAVVVPSTTAAAINSTRTDASQIGRAAPHGSISADTAAAVLPSVRETLLSPPPFTALIDVGTVMRMSTVAALSPATQPAAQNDITSSQRSADALHSPTGSMGQQMPEAVGQHVDIGSNELTSPLFSSINGDSGGSGGMVFATPSRSLATDVMNLTSHPPACTTTSGPLILTPSSFLRSARATAPVTPNAEADRNASAPEPPAATAQLGGVPFGAQDLLMSPSYPAVTPGGHAYSSSPGQSSGTSSMHISSVNTAAVDTTVAAAGVQQLPITLSGTVPSAAAAALFPIVNNVVDAVFMLYGLPLEVFIGSLNGGRCPAELTTSLLGRQRSIPSISEVQHTDALPQQADDASGILMLYIPPAAAGSSTNLCSLAMKFLGMALSATRTAGEPATLDIRPCRVTWQAEAWDVTTYASFTYSLTLSGGGQSQSAISSSSSSASAASSSGTMERPVLQPASWGGSATMGGDAVPVSEPSAATGGSGRPASASYVSTPGGTSTNGALSSRSTGFSGGGEYPLPPPPQQTAAAAGRAGRRGRGG